MGEHIEADITEWQGYETVAVRAGKKQTRTVVPPAGKDYAYEFADWPVRVGVTVSPAGRVVHVYVNGKCVHKQRGRRKAEA